MKPRRNRSLGRVLGLLTIVVLVLAGLQFVSTSQSANAANAAEFNPELIISDELFYDSNAMSQSEIQAFLNLKIGTCLNGNCLNVGSFPAISRPLEVSSNTGNVRCYAMSVAAVESAASLIFKAQQACGISAKVLLVTLQKEQALVTSRSPSKAALDRAMGFACPDTAPCAATTLGFANQVYAGALQLKTYRASAFGVQPGIRAVYYHPNAACGAGTINIRNYATAALYNYTPYQPNAAAMRNLYGVGDGCSSYGNRNFWVFYTDWFGSTGAIGELRIAEAYARWGGASGVLGAAIGTPNAISSNGGGLVQGYANGAIAWSSKWGAFPVMGSIREYYGANGGVGGSFGWPAGDPFTLTASGGGTVQSFTGGAITSSPTAGTFSIAGAMRTYFNTVGGLGGALGWPAGDSSCEGSICTQKFMGGVAYLKGSTDGHYTTVALDAAYQAAGGPSGSLGWPATDPIPLASHGGGFVQAFVNGALAGTNGGTAFPLIGDIRNAFNAAGGIGGALGWPTSAQSCSSGTCTQQFTGGSVYWSEAKGGRYSAGAIDTAYRAKGATTSTLGWPVTGMLPFANNGGGEVQGFETAAMASSPAGAFVLSGDLRAVYNSVGGVAGVLGWPTADGVCTAGICSQTFQNGATFWSAATGGASSQGPIAVAYLAAGGPGSSLGWPVTGNIPFTANGGGQVQGFQNAAMASSAAGTFALSGGLRNYYNTLGGITGSLGWPTGAMSCVGDVCTQSFQGGTLEYSTAGGGRLL